MNQPFDIERYSESMTEAEAAVLRTLHEMIADLPGITAKERYKIPFYYGKSWICYLNKHKKGGIELAFTRAIEMEEVHSLLDFNGRKQIGGIRVASVEDLDEDIVLTLLYTAIELDQEKSYKHTKGS
jgi:hypothetical protein